jgi:uncharacterized protein
VSNGFVAVLRIELHFPDAGSLKAKRSELNAIKAGIHQRFGAAVAEVDHHERWQRSTLLAAVCAGSAGRADDHAEAVRRWVDARTPHGAAVLRRVVSWDDMESVH